jgi:stage V sporulation protein G
LDKERKILAYVNITLEDVLVIRGIRITEKVDGKRIMAMPSRQNKAGEYVDVCFPITNQFREQIERVIFNHVDKMMEQEQPDGIAQNAG